MMLGVEGDFQMTKQKQSDRSWDVFNHDIYLQLTYALPKWQFTIGNRLMFYRYQLKDDGQSKKYAQTRDNANACIIYVPCNRHQIQLGYYHKFYNSAHASIFSHVTTLSDEEWAITKGLLDEQSIHQLKLAYAYSQQKLTVKAETSHYVIDDSSNLTELAASVYWKTKLLTLTGGLNLYADRHVGYAAFRLAPTAYLPHQWQLGMQLVYYTSKSPKREYTGMPVYGCLSLNKQFGNRWSIGIDWHDMFDALNSRKVELNRHAVIIKLQYRY